MGWLSIFISEASVYLPLIKPKDQKPFFFSSGANYTDLFAWTLAFSLRPALFNRWADNKNNFIIFELAKR